MFWDLTPFQTQLVMAGRQKQMLSLAWHIAWFSRQKKLPSYEHAMGQQRNENELKALLSGRGRKK